MKFQFSLLNNGISIEPGEICNLTIENVQAFRKALEDLLMVREDILFYDGDQEIKSKEMLVLDTLYDIDVNDKKLLSILYKDLGSFVNDDFMIDHTLKLNEAIYEYVETLEYEYDFPIEYDQDIDYQVIFKALGIKFHDDHESFLEKIIDYINIVIKFQPIKVVCFVNLMVFLSQEEVEYLVNYANTNQLVLFNLERYQSNYSVNNCIEILFDRDLCQVM